MARPYYREQAEQEYARAYGRGRKLMRYSDEPSPAVVEFAASRYFKKVTRVVDFACGEGIDALYLSKQGRAVVGFDIAAAAVQKAVGGAVTGKTSPVWLVGDMVRCPFKDSTFDVALSISSFGRLLEDDHRRAFLDETFRVLRPGGYFLMTAGVLLEEVRLSFPEVFREIREKRGDELEVWLEEEREGKYRPPSQRYETRAGYERMLQEAGYRIIHSRLDVSAHVWGIVLWARKP